MWIFTCEKFRDYCQTTNFSRWIFKWRAFQCPTECPTGSCWPMCLSQGCKWSTVMTVATPGARSRRTCRLLPVQPFCWERGKKLRPTGRIHRVRKQIDFFFFLVVRSQFESCLNLALFCSNNVIVSSIGGEQHVRLLKCKLQRICLSHPLCFSRLDCLPARLSVCLSVCLSL